MSNSGRKNPMSLDLYHHRYTPRAGSTRTFALFHGTGGDETSLVSLAELIDPDASILAVRGNVLENGSPRFFRRFAEGVFDMEDIHHRAGELQQFLTDACGHYSIDPSSIVALGYSNGANIVSSMLLLGSELPQTAILLRAMNTIKPAAGASLHRRNVLMVNGRMDPIVNVDDASRLARKLSELGASVTIEWTDTGHSLSRQDVELAVAFLNPAR
jgi:predicted esterase